MTRHIYLWRHIHIYQLWLAAIYMPNILFPCKILWDVFLSIITDQRYDQQTVRNRRKKLYVSFFFVKVAYLTALSSLLLAKFFLLKVKLNKQCYMIALRVSLRAGRIGKGGERGCSDGWKAIRDLTNLTCWKKCKTFNS